MSHTEKELPPIETVIDWLAANLGYHATAALTGTDTRALKAAEAILELYAYDRETTNLHAFAIVVSRMQMHTRYLAYHTIAKVMDWHDRSRVWHLAGLKSFLAVLPMCSFEPDGLKRDMREDA